MHVVAAVALFAALADPLQLQIDPCTRTDETLVRRIVVFELGQSADAPESMSVRVTCENDSVIVTSVAASTGKPSRRELHLSEEGWPRSRLLGVAIAEAALASRLEMQLTPAAADQPEEKPPLAPQAVAATSSQPAASSAPRERGHALIAELAGRRFGSGLWAYGLGLSARTWWRAHPSLGWGLSVEGTRAQRTVNDVGTGRVADLSLAPRVFARVERGPSSLWAGAGWRLGVARLLGDPATLQRLGQSQFALWGGPQLSLDLQVHGRGPLFVGLGLESGYAILSARGVLSDVTVLALAGLWLRAALSVGAAW